MKLHIKPPCWSQYARKIVFYMHINHVYPVRVFNIDTHIILFYFILNRRGRTSRKEKKTQNWEGVANEKV